MNLSLPNIFMRQLLHNILEQYFLIREEQYINLSEYIRRSLIIAGILLPIIYFIGKESSILFFVFLIFFIYIIAVTTTKRWKDTGESVRKLIIYGGLLVLLLVMKIMIHSRSYFLLVLEGGMTIAYFILTTKVMLQLLVPSRYASTPSNSNGKESCIIEIIGFILSLIFSILAIIIGIYLGVILSSGHGTTQMTMIGIMIGIIFFLAPPIGILMYFSTRALYIKIRKNKEILRQNHELPPSNSPKEIKNESPTTFLDIHSIDTQNIDKIVFTHISGKSYSIELDSIKKIAVYIFHKYNKTEFGPQELESERGFLIQSFSSHLSPENYKLLIDTLTQWMQEGGKYAIITK